MIVLTLFLKNKEILSKNTRKLFYKILQTFFLGILQDTESWLHVVHRGWLYGYIFQEWKILFQLVHWYYKLK